MKKNSTKGVVLSCSGSCPIGALCDAVTRRLHQEGEARMLGLSQIISQQSVESELALAGSILVIEGCQLGCIRHSLSDLGYTDEDYKFLDLTTLGFDQDSQPKPADVQRAYGEALKLIEG